jgi:mannose-6-phosphate isomerase-like protein (cupin superfamily)
MNRSMTFGAGVAAGLMMAGGLWLGAQALSADTGAQAAAQKPATMTAVKPGMQKNTSKVVLENARVRVKEAVFYPGDAHPGMHTHELAHVGVIIEGGTLVFGSPDGKTETMNLAAGGVGYRDANVTHEPVNPGTKPVRVIEVELK